MSDGYVKLIEAWGSDERIIASARMSTDRAFRGWGETPLPLGAGVIQHKPGDERLLRYLYENGHMTPFEMCGATFEVQAPIYVFRQWQRHRTFSYNELSARYTEMPDLFEIPEEFRLQDTKNKQGSVPGFDGSQNDFAREIFAHAVEEARVAYQVLLELGVAREQARGVLPVCQYSRMRASGNLRNWLHFLNLRTDLHAQKEIRDFANEIAKILTEKFPRTMDLWREGRDNG